MRRALVTGGTRGIGLSVAEELMRAGHQVTVSWAHDEAAARDAESRGLTAVRCDVADSAAVEKMFAGERDRGFQILVHAAGFTRDALMMMMPERDFDAVLGVHLKGGFLVAKQAMRAMIAARWGRIVSIVSPSAILGRAGQTSYAAAKAGLIGLTRSLAREVARWNITVNCVSAGLVDTKLTAELPENVRAELISHIPLARAGTPQEIAYATEWLCSERSSYVTGQVLGVDGGLT